MGVSTYASISVHSTKSQRRITIHFPSSWTYSMLLVLPGYYLKIDLKHAYHLICIVEGDKPKMAFQTHYRSFEWRVMPFGLSNAPAVFQWSINDILGNLLDICAVGYIDDILIYSNSLDEHKDHIWDVLQCL